ncbi:MAG: hypothetical protein ACYSU8_09275 [Planctomycetota bacterium]|jgi:hypothetical protein
MQNFRNAIASQLIIIFFLVGTCFAIDARPLNQEEKNRLGAAWDKHIHRFDSSIDITYSKKTIHSASFTEARRQLGQQEAERMRKSLNRPELEYKSIGVKTPENGEIFFSHSRIQIKDSSSYREDVVIFGDKKKEKKIHDEIHIWNNETNLKIDKQRKLVTYSNSRWGIDNNNLAYGTLLAHRKEIGSAIFRLRFSGTKNKEFRYKGLVEVAGIDTVAIELFDFKNEHPVYEIFLDVNDWAKLCKCILYNKDGTAVTKISEFLEFSKGKEDKVDYPHLIIQQQFDAEGKEESRDIIDVEQVSVGLSISDDVFELNVGEDYTIMTNN